MQYALINNDNTRIRTLTELASVPWDRRRLIKSLEPGETGPDGERVLPLTEVRPPLPDGGSYGQPTETELNGGWIITYPVKTAGELAAAQAAETKARCLANLEIIQAILADFKALAVLGVTFNPMPANRAEAVKQIDMSAISFDALKTLQRIWWLRDVLCDDAGGRWGDVLFVAGGGLNG